MNIIVQLSSQTGDSTEESNKKVVELCLKDPTLLKDITGGLKNKDVGLVGDCAEVFTKVAETNPELIVLYAKELTSLLENKNTRVRWEATHALALIADLIPGQISSLLFKLHRMALSDTSTIVRDYSVIAVGNYAKSGKKASEEALTVLKRVLEVWGEKQAARALKGLQNAAETNPQLAKEVVSLAKGYENSSKGTVKKVAKDLLKAIDK